MIRFLQRLNALLIRMEEKACGVLLILMTGVICYGMFERFVIRYGIGWTDELSRYISIWAIFIGASLGIMRGAHVGVEVFVHMLPPALQRVAFRISMLVCTVFTGSLTFFAFRYFLRLAHSSQITPAMQVPLSWAFSAVPAGAALMCLHFAIRLVLPQEEKNG